MYVFHVKDTRKSISKHFVNPNEKALNTKLEITLLIDQINCYETYVQLKIIWERSSKTFEY